MNKYHAKKTTVDNITFDSEKEAHRYGELRILERVGMITDLVCHPTYVLQEGFIWHGKKIRPITYEADFSYIEGGQRITEDVKGSEKTITALAKVKIKMFKKLYPEIMFRLEV